MRLSPLEIRKQDFNRRLRGYDPDEVEAYRETLARQFAEMEDELRRRDDRLASLEVKLQHYERVEEALQQAIETARESSRHAMANAEAKAEQIRSEAQDEARGIKRDAEQERHRLRQETQAIAARRKEIVARLRAFLMSEMEMLAHFEGEDPVGFIRLMPQGRGRLPAAPSDGLGPYDAPATGETDDYSTDDDPGDAPSRTAPAPPLAPLAPPPLSSLRADDAPFGEDDGRMPSPEELVAEALAAEDDAYLDRLLAPDGSAPATEEASAVHVPLDALRAGEAAPAEDAAAWTAAPHYAAAPDAPTFETAGEMPGVEAYGAQAAEDARASDAPRDEEPRPDPALDERADVFAAHPPGPVAPDPQADADEEPPRAEHGDELAVGLRALETDEDADGPDAYATVAPVSDGSTARPPAPPVADEQAHPEADDAPGAAARMPSERSRPGLEPSAPPERRVSLSDIFPGATPPPADAQVPFSPAPFAADEPSAPPVEETPAEEPPAPLSPPAYVNEAVDLGIGAAPPDDAASPFDASAARASAPGPDAAPPPLPGAGYRGDAAEAMRITPSSEIRFVPVDDEPGASPEAAPAAEATAFDAPAGPEASSWLPDLPPPSDAPAVGRIPSVWSDELLDQLMPPVGPRPPAPPPAAEGVAPAAEESAASALPAPPPAGPDVPEAVPDFSSPRTVTRSGYAVESLLGEISDPAAPVASPAHHSRLPEASPAPEERSVSASGEEIARIRRLLSGLG